MTAFKSHMWNITDEASRLALGCLTWACQIVLSPSPSVSPHSCHCRYIWYNGGVEQKQVLCISSTFLFPPQNVTWLDRVVRAHYCEIQLDVSVWLLPQNIFFRCVKKNGENVVQVELPQKWRPNKNKAKDSCCLSSL